MHNPDSIFANAGAVVQNPVNRGKADTGSTREVFGRGSQQIRSSLCPLPFSRKAARDATDLRYAPQILLAMMCVPQLSISRALSTGRQAGAFNREEYT
jgi:hypothetical protein